MTHIACLSYFISHPFSHTAHACYPTSLIVVYLIVFYASISLKSLRSDHSEQVFVLSHDLTAKLGRTQQTQAQKRLAGEVSSYFSTFFA